MPNTGKENDLKCWMPGEATTRIREKANAKSLRLIWTLHAKERMTERGIIMGDILSVLKNGFVYSDPEEATRKGHFKYQMEGRTPNSNGKVIKIIVIPGLNSCLKIVSVMWRDEL